MSALQHVQQPDTLRPTRLRDFGAFRADVASLETLKLAQVSLSPTHMVTPLPTTPLHRVAREQGKERRTGRSLLTVAVRVFFTSALCVWLLHTISWQALFSVLRTVTLGMVMVSISIGAFGTVISSYQWRTLLQGERIRRDLADLIDLYLVGVAFSHFLPTGMGGDVVKAVYVGREAGNQAGSASAVVMSRVTGFFGMVVLAFPVLLLWHSSFTASVISGFVLLSLLVGGVIGGAVCCATVLPRFAQGTWLSGLGRIGSLITKGMQIGEALKRAVQRPRFLLLATLYGIQFWVIGCLNYYCYATALGMHVPLYFYFVAIPFVSLVTFLPISINGYGMRETILVSVFATMHVPAATALLLALLMDAQVLFFGVLGGAIYLLMSKKGTSITGR